MTVASGSARTLGAGSVALPIAVRAAKVRRRGTSARSASKEIARPVGRAARPAPGEAIAGSLVPETATAAGQAPGHVPARVTGVTVMTGRGAAGRPGGAAGRASAMPGSVPGLAIGRPAVAGVISRAVLVRGPAAAGVTGMTGLAVLVRGLAGAGGMRVVPRRRAAVLVGCPAVTWMTGLATLVRGPTRVGGVKTAPLGRSAVTGTPRAGGAAMIAPMSPWAAPLGRSMAPGPGAMRTGAAGREPAGLVHGQVASPAGATVSEALVAPASAPAGAGASRLRVSSVARGGSSRATGSSAGTPGGRPAVGTQGGPAGRDGRGGPGTATPRAGGIRGMAGRVAAAGVAGTTGAGPDPSGVTGRGPGRNATS